MWSILWHPFYDAATQVYLKLWFTLRQESTPCLLIKGLAFGLVYCRDNRIKNNYFDYIHFYSAVSYKTIRHRLGDEILHRDQLIDVEFDDSSPSNISFDD